MKKDFSNVIKNLKCEIINSIIEEFETYNKNEVEFYVGTDDEKRVEEFCDLCAGLTLNNYDGTTSLPKMLIKDDDDKLFILYEVEDNKGETMSKFVTPLDDTEHINVDEYNTLYNILMNEDLRKTNMNNNN